MRIILYAEHIHVLQRTGSLAIGVLPHLRSQDGDLPQAAPCWPCTTLLVAEQWAEDGSSGFLYRADAGMEEVQVQWLSASRMPRRVGRMAVKVSDVQPMRYSDWLGIGPQFLFAVSKYCHRGCNLMLVPSRTQGRPGRDPWLVSNSRLNPFFWGWPCLNAQKKINLKHKTRAK